jgi:hypothetical protein
VEDNFAGLKVLSATSLGNLEKFRDSLQSFSVNWETESRNLTKLWDIEGA